MSDITPGKWEPVYVSGCIIGVGVPVKGLTFVTGHKMVCNTLFEGDEQSDLPRREADAKLIAQTPTLKAERDDAVKMVEALYLTLTTATKPDAWKEIKAEARALLDSLNK